MLFAKSMITANALSHNGNALPCTKPHLAESTTLRDIREVLGCLGQFMSRPCLSKYEQIEDSIDGSVDSKNAFLTRTGPETA